jgi:hypothetical protein
VVGFEAIWLSKVTFYASLDMSTSSLPPDPSTTLRMVAV